jgi:hypothetical protein
MKKNTTNCFMLFLRTPNSFLPTHKGLRLKTKGSSFKLQVQSTKYKVKIKSSEFKVRVPSSELRVRCSVLRVQCSKFNVRCSEFGVGSKRVKNKSIAMHLTPDSELLTLNSSLLFHLGWQINHNPGIFPELTFKQQPPAMLV